MDDFVKFWDWFSADADHQNEKERCEKYWYLMPDAKKQSILRDVDENRKPNNILSPYVYLFNYYIPLRFVRQGTKAFDKWREDNLAAGKRMCLIRFEERIANCLSEDLPAMIEAGAVLINGDWK